MITTDPNVDKGNRTPLESHNKWGHLQMRWSFNFISCIWKIYHMLLRSERSLLLISTRRKCKPTLNAPRGIWRTGSGALVCMWLNKKAPFHLHEVFLVKIHVRVKTLKRWTLSTLNVLSINNLSNNLTQTYNDIIYIRVGINLLNCVTTLIAPPKKCVMLPC